MGRAPRAGFSQLEIFANDRLDVAIVRGYYASGHFRPGGFFKSVFDRHDEAFMTDLQALLIKHNLSGNMLVHAVA